MGRLKLLDLFSGIGGFTLAADRAGIETVAFCEIEKFPKAVLAYRYPNIPIFDDVCKLNKENFYEKTKLEEIDIVCGGSPCQDMSVAGVGAGLNASRSGLFFEQVRIAFELKAKYVVWENVPGALSSCKGADFAKIISAFTGYENIQIPKLRWGNAGFFRGKSGFYNVAYRIFDSRFFGVPQRRRRIFLVASLGNANCAKILFEQEGLRRNIAKVSKPKQNPAAFAESSFGGYSETELSQTLTKSSGSCSGGSETLVVSETSPSAQKTSPTLTAGMSHTYNKQTPILFESHAQDARYSEKDMSPTITSRSGTGGGNLPLIVKQHNHGEVRISKEVPTLNAQSGAGRMPMALLSKKNVSICIPIDLSNALRQGDEKRTGLGVGKVNSPMMTLKSIAHAVCFTPNDAARDTSEDLAPTLRSGGSGGVPVQAVAIAENVINRQDHNGGNGVGALEENCYTLNASGVHAVATRSQIRRLTPLECERLQGFPDNWTNIPTSCDTNRYKALGNAITVNVAEWIFKRLANLADE